MKKSKKNVILILSIVLLFMGTFCLYLSFKKEVLNDKYVVDSVREVNNDFSNLENGQVDVVQNITYQRDGVFKITFNCYSKHSKDTIVLKKDTTVVITDNIGDSYVLLSDLTINDIKYRFKDNSFTSSNNINLTYNDNHQLQITIPSDLLDYACKIEVFLKLNSYKTNYKHYTNNDCYYSIFPDSSNPYYLKSTNQSYLINGSGYIILE